MDLQPVEIIQKRIAIQQKVLEALEKAGRGKDQAANNIRRQIEMLNNSIEELQAKQVKQQKTQSQITDYLEGLLAGKASVVVDATQLGIPASGKACLVRTAAAVHYTTQQFPSWTIAEILMLAQIDQQRRFEFHRAKALGAIGWFLEGPEFEEDLAQLKKIFGDDAYAS